MAAAHEIRHAGLIARWGKSGWVGVLIEGPSGVGKSDLALRALRAGYRLVADDRTLVFPSGGRLFGRAPTTLKDLIEARGVGLLSVPALTIAPVAARLDLTEDSAAPPRLPDPDRTLIQGVPIPSFRFFARDAGAVARLDGLLRHLGGASGKA